MTSDLAQCAIKPEVVKTLPSSQNVAALDCTRHGTCLLNLGRTFNVERWSSLPLACSCALSMCVGRPGYDAASAIDVSAFHHGSVSLVDLSVTPWRQQFRGIALDLTIQRHGFVGQCFRKGLRFNFAWIVHLALSRIQEVAPRINVIDL